MEKMWGNNLYSGLSHSGFKGMIDAMIKASAVPEPKVENFNIDKFCSDLMEAEDRRKLTQTERRNDAKYSIKS